MKNTFLITGATGFVGANITRALIKKGEHVSIIVRNKKLNWRLKDLAPKIDIHETDILNPYLAKIVEKIRPDYIFHLAAYGVYPHENDLSKMVDININGTINLLQALKKNPFKLFINAGSSVEYGVKDNKMKETDILEPVNDYGITKAAASLYCQKEGLRNELPIITFRMFTPYGYYEDKNRLIPSIILSALKNQPINISIPTNVRDFIFIDDVVESYLKAVRIRFVPGRILNIGMGKQYTIENVVDMVLKITKSKSKVEWGTVKQQERFIEPKMWEADISRVKKLLQWKKIHTLEEGLRKTITWFEKNQNLYVS